MFKKKATLLLIMVCFSSLASAVGNDEVIYEDITYSENMRF